MREIVEVLELILKKINDVYSDPEKDAQKRGEEMKKVLSSVASLSDAYMRMGADVLELILKKIREDQEHKNMEKVRLSLAGSKADSNDVDMREVVRVLELILEKINDVYSDPEKDAQKRSEKMEKEVSYLVDNFKGVDMHEGALALKSILEKIRGDLEYKNMEKVILSLVADLNDANMCKEAEVLKLILKKINLQTKLKKSMESKINEIRDESKTLEPVVEFIREDPGKKGEELDEKIKILCADLAYKEQERRPSWAIYLTSLPLLVIVLILGGVFLVGLPKEMVVKMLSFQVKTYSLPVIPVFTAVVVGTAYFFGFLRYIKK